MDGHAPFDFKASSSFRKRMASCNSEHPGLCKTKNRDQLEDVQSLFNQFCQFLSAAGIGKTNVGTTLLRFSSLSGPEPTRLMFYLGFMLLRPRRQVLVACDCENGGALPCYVTVHLDGAGRTLKHRLTHALLREMLDHKHDAWQVATLEFEDETLIRTKALRVLREALCVCGGLWVRQAAPVTNSKAISWPFPRQVLAHANTNSNYRTGWGSGRDWGCSFRFLVRWPLRPPRRGAPA
jgi:hypothetical protein